VDPALTGRLLAIQSQSPSVLSAAWLGDYRQNVKTVKVYHKGFTVKISDLLG
jgi:hypothetical protein